MFERGQNPQSLTDDFMPRSPVETTHEPDATCIAFVAVMK
jgi:hypothetical protein